MLARRHVLQALLSTNHLLQLQPGLLLQALHISAVPANPGQQSNPAWDHRQHPVPSATSCDHYAAAAPAAAPGQPNQSTSENAGTPQTVQLQSRAAPQTPCGHVGTSLRSQNSSSDSSSMGAELGRSWQSSCADMSAVTGGRLQQRQGATPLSQQHRLHVPWRMQELCQYSTQKLHTCSSSSSSSSSDAAPPGREAADPTAAAAAAAAAGQAPGPAVADEDYPDEGEVLLDEFEAFDEAVDGGVVDSEWTNEGAVSTSSHEAYQEDSADEYDVEFDEDFDFEDEEGLQDNLPAGTDTKDANA